MNTKNLWIIYSKRMAWTLRTQGFEIVKTEPNYRKPQADVYFFENTPELQEAIQKYLANK